MGYDSIYLAGNIPYNTWLVKSYIDTIPRSLDEAARIDGASNARTFFQIVLTSKPVVVFLTITSFTDPWMEFIFSKMISSFKRKSDTCSWTLQLCYRQEK